VASSLGQMLRLEVGFSMLGYVCSVMEATAWYLLVLHAVFWAWCSGGACTQYRAALHQRGYKKAWGI
jgi:hypothetical protein